MLLHSHLQPLLFYLFSNIVFIVKTLKEQNSLFHFICGSSLLQSCVPTQWHFKSVEASGETLLGGLQSAFQGMTRSPIGEVSYRVVIAYYPLVVKGRGRCILRHCSGVKLVNPQATPNSLGAPSSCLFTSCASVFRPHCVYTVGYTSTNT